MSEARVNLTIHGYDATRWMWSRRAARQYDAARQFLGIDAENYSILRLRDHRGERPDLVAFGARVGDCEMVVCLDAPGAKPIRVPTHRAGEVFGDLLLERDPEVRHQFGNRFAFGFRNEFWHGGIERYEPQTEAERAMAADTRRQRKVERQERKWREDNPLFADVTAPAAPSSASSR
jgi:hypothetical protein